MRIRKIGIWILIVGILTIGIIFIFFQTFGKASLESFKIEQSLRNNEPALQQYSRVKEWVEKAEQKQYDDVAVLVNLGFEWKSLGDITGNRLFYNKALDVYRMGIEKFGEKNIPFYWNAGKVAETVQEYDQAEFFYKEAVRVAPTYSESYRYLAELYENKFKKDDSVIRDTFEKGLIATKGEPSLYLDKCSYLRRHSYFKDALDCYAVLSEAYPDNQGFQSIVKELKASLK